MPINEIKVKKINIPLKGTFKYFLSTLDKLPYVLVTVQEGDLVGIGEAAAAADITGETQESVISIINLVRPFLLGRRLESKQDIEEMFTLINSQVVANQAAKAGLEMALLDLLGKKKGLPVYKLLGGINLGSLQVQKTFGFFNENNLEKEVKDSIDLAKKLGAKMIKYKAGLNNYYDLEVVKIARAYDGKIPITLDVNQGWVDYRHARPMFKALKPYHLSWIEQPVFSTDYDGLAALRKEFKIPVMIDEGVKTISDCELIRFKHAADLLNIKLTKVGGFLPAQKIIAFCKKNKIRYILGDMVHSNIGMAANLHLAALGDFISYDIDNGRIKRDVAVGIIRDGLTYEIPQKPGLGIELK
jgi:L-Ala-D/L-Glu epimerase